MTTIPLELLLKRAIRNQLETCDEDTHEQPFFPLVISYLPPQRNNDTTNRKIESIHQKLYCSSWRVLESHWVSVYFTSETPLIGAIYNLIYLTTGNKKFWDILPTQYLDKLFGEEDLPLQKIAPEYVN